MDTSETVVIDMPGHLLERVKRLEASCQWGLQATLLHLLEHGLFSCEAELSARRFNESDSRALQAAIAALREIPDDPGFALIGRVR